MKRATSFGELILQTAAQHPVAAVIWVVCTLFWLYWFGVRDTVVRYRAGIASAAHGRAMGAVLALPFFVAVFLKIYWNK